MRPERSPVPGDAEFQQMEMAAKPNTTVVMGRLIAQVRTALPFAAPESLVCEGDCQVCSMKLLAFLDGELTDWERRLEAGERPGLADLSGLATAARQVHAVLQRNGLVGPLPDADRSAPVGD